MCDELEIFEYLESEYRHEKKKRRQCTRDINNPLKLNENEFIDQYRLSKDLFCSLCKDLEPIMRRTKHQRSSDLSIETKVLTAIYVYAHGSYQKRTGSAQQVAQQTVSSVLAEVTAAMNHINMRKKYIKFPQTPAERDVNKLRFYEQFGIPDVIGCIDATHVAIIRPSIHEERFFCEKNYYSLNVQVICNANMDIISVDASHPGAYHDSFIWSHHPLRPHLEKLSSTEAIWFLGDPAYPISKTMMTPISKASPQTPEAYYNEKHAKAWNTIQKTICVLKARFRCLLAHRALHYQPQVAGSITNACVILHNICNSAKLPVPELTDDELQQEVLLQSPDLNVDPVDQEKSDLKIGIATREELVKRLWQLRQMD
ncbi:putative nuclease HARBI1 [Bicyclus anynana]|uniref:Nuclease HARBI1 n=1 Tax=Bicyclus anynana TaxID=110368 RepID=A0A6J1NW37_BICAN|nr:putative nuclease HARBI1 [Bicyclus anynana]